MYILEGRDLSLFCSLMHPQLDKYLFISSIQRHLINICWRHQCDASIYLTEQYHMVALVKACGAAAHPPCTGLWLSHVLPGEGPEPSLL